MEGRYNIATGGRTAYDVSLDGQRFLLIKAIDDTSDGDLPQIVVVQNWFEELNRLAPPSE